MMPKQRWFKFWVSDWRSDPKLRMCSIGARGLWLEMICLMHEAEPYGHLIIGEDQPSHAQLANMVGMQVEALTPLLDELERNGVFSRRHSGVIYSRKMVKLDAISEKRSAAVSTRYQGETAPRKPKGTAGAKPDETSDGSVTVPFDVFWSAWPNKIQKKSAEKAWSKLNQDEQKAAAGTLESWWELWRRTYPDASPIHASTYLNGRRWEDDFAGTSAQMDPDIARWAGMK